MPSRRPELPAQLGNTSLPTKRFPPQTYSKHGGKGGPLWRAAIQRLIICRQQRPRQHKENSVHTAPSRHVCVCVCVCVCNAAPIDQHSHWRTTPRTATAHTATTHAKREWMRAVSGVRPAGSLPEQQQQGHRRVHCSAATRRPLRAELLALDGAVRGCGAAHGHGRRRRCCARPGPARKVRRRRDG